MWFRKEGENSTKITQRGRGEDPWTPNKSSVTNLSHMKSPSLPFTGTCRYHIERISSGSQLVPVKDSRRGTALVPFFGVFFSLPLHLELLNQN